MLPLQYAIPMETLCVSVFPLASKPICLILSITLSFPLPSFPGRIPLFCSLPSVNLFRLVSITRNQSKPSSYILLMNTQKKMHALSHRCAITEIRFSPLTEFLICLRKHGSAVLKHKRALATLSDAYSVQRLGETYVQQSATNARESVAFYARHCRTCVRLMNEPSNFRFNSVAKSLV